MRQVHPQTWAATWEALIQTLWRHLNRNDAMKSEDSRSRTQFTRLLYAFLSALLIPCLLSGCFLANLDMKRQVRRYSGDGTIENCATFSWPGFQIQFPSFDASKAFDASYRLSRVPQLHKFGRTTDAYLFLRFRWHEDSENVDELKKHVTAAYRFVLLDSTGRILQSAELPFSSSIWGGAELYGVYDLDKSKIHFQPDASYTLKVSYDPGTNPPPAQRLYFSIENGCSK